MEQQRDERSLGELFAELARETSTLVRQEVALARTEMTQKATQVGRDAGVIGIGGAIAYAGLLAVVAALILLLGQYIPLWLSALIVGLVVAGAGYVLIQRGLSALKRADLTPRETIATLKEDAEWAKDQTK
jgi:putative superfamily III holin-X